MGINTKITLNDGNEIPQLGLGVFRATQGKMTVDAVLAAFAAGYRHIDTASIYQNEESVGMAIRESGLPREEIFVTTKLWRDDHGFDAAQKAVKVSLDKLGLDYIDLYLSHWPTVGLRLDAWRSMEKMVADGLAKSIGVSNYMIHHLEELLSHCETVPSVNQLELSPYNYLHRKPVIDFCKQKNIVLEAYSPLTKGKKLNDFNLVSIANALGKSSAQLLIRWAIQMGFVVLPKSTNAVRIASNADVFDFELSEAQMVKLESLNEDLVTGWDPTQAP